MRDVLVGVFLFSLIGLIAIGLMESAPSYAPGSGIAVSLERADTEELKAKGLTGHAPLEGDSGMLFEFEYPQVICMWNKNVNFPVSVGFFDSQWRLLNAEEMAEHSEKKTCSIAPASFAIEMRDGWFDLNNKEVAK